MSYRRALLSAVAVVVLFASGCGGSDEQAAAREPLRLEADTVEGERIVIDDLVGTDTVLWFWAPW